ncbi:MAG TPA: TonB-dependent receptor plug domain-containing protein, partial [Myxococcota bacterium]|nr:TonB-dependent receptor plug domain-containing protein [Myxococcota bacterium]
MPFSENLVRHPFLAALRALRALARAAALAGLAAAPAAGEPQPVTLEPVVVEGSAFVPELELDNEAAREEIERTPGGVALVPDQRIDETRGATLQDALDYVPGVLVRSRGTGEEPQLSIRGSGLRNNFHTRGVNVWIDGVPFHNADGFSDVESLELLAAERIEVYKGANSLRYGGSALGGGIQLVTRNGRSAEPVRLRTEGGSFGYLKTFASTGAARGPWEAYLAASDTRSHGFRDHAEQDRQRLYASLGHRFDGGAALRVFVNGVRNRQELPGALTRAEFRDDPSQASPASELQDEARDYDYGRAALALAVPVGDYRSVELYGQLNHQDLWHPLAFGIIDNETTNANGELRFVAADPLFGL